MKERIGAYTRQELLFFAAYIVYFMVTITKNTRIVDALPVPGLIDILKLGAVCIILFKILAEEEYNVNHLLIYFAILIVMVCVCYNIDSMDLLYSICLVLAARNISYHKILKVTFYLQFIICIIMFVGIYMGLIENVMMGNIVWNTTIINEDSVMRYDLGFGHPNRASAFVFFMSLVYLCLRKKCTFIETVICIIINYMVYQKTGSRTCFLVMIIFIPLMYWFANKKRLGTYWRFCLAIAPIIIIFLSLFMQIFYNPDNEIMVKINEILSGRLMLGHNGFLDYGITLFGQEIHWIRNWNNEYGLPYNYVDSAYMRILLENGIVVFGIFCILCVITMYRLASAGKNKLCIAFLALLVHSMVEMFIYDVPYQPFFLLMGQLEIIDIESKL